MQRNWPIAFGPLPPTLLLTSLSPRYHTAVGALIYKHLHGEVVLAAPATNGIGLEARPTWVRRLDGLAFQCLMFTDKALAGTIIERASAQGQHVVLDRWWPSAYAYNDPKEVADEWILEASERLPSIDTYFLLDLPAEAAFERVKERASRTGRTIDRYENLDKLRVVRQRYLDLAGQTHPLPAPETDGHGAGIEYYRTAQQEHDAQPWCVIDVTREMDEVERDIVRALRRRHPSAFSYLPIP